MLIVIAFGRAMSAALLQVAFLYTPEVGLILHSSRVVLNSSNIFKSILARLSLF